MAVKLSDFDAVKFFF